jgi:hypothetical protein
MLKRVPCRIAILVSLLLNAPAVAQAEGPVATVRPDGSPNRAAWMAQGSYGMMTHYLITPKGNTPAEKTADLNRIANQFDVDHYIRQFQETGADWLIFTLGQCTGYLCSPNAYLDSRDPGRTPHRDIALEIAKRLKPLGKRMILYFPSETDTRLLPESLGFGTPGYADRYFEVLKQYSLKFGTLHHGWWFDACGPHPDDYWRKWLATVRAGNPEAVVAFSGAEFCTGGPVNPLTKFSDYHAGEIHLLENGQIRRDFLYPEGSLVISAEAKLRKKGQEARFYMPDAPLIDGVQWHGLLPIGWTFNPAIPNQFCHYTDKELFEFVRRIKKVGGALTINVPIDIETGHIPADSHSQLVRLGKSLGCSR